MRANNLYFPDDALPPRASGLTRWGLRAVSLLAVVLLSATLVPPFLPASWAARDADRNAHQLRVEDGRAILQDESLTPEQRRQGMHRVLRSIDENLKLLREVEDSSPEMAPYAKIARESIHKRTER